MVVRVPLLDNFISYFGTWYGIELKGSVPLVVDMQYVQLRG
jgi:hypothetical protein